MSPIKKTASSNPADDAVAAKVGNEVFYYRLYGTTIYKYSEPSAATNTNLHNWTHGGGGQGMCTDGTYIYRSSGTNSNQIFRTKLPTVFSN